MCLLLSCSFVYGQRGKEKRELPSTREYPTTGIPTPPLGIYKGTIHPSTRPLNVLPNIYIVPVSAESAAQQSLKQEVVTGFVEGVVVPDYIPDSTGNNIVAYSIVAELTGQENGAVRYISFDQDIMKLFEELAFSPDKKPNSIFLYGLEMNIEEASKVAGVSLASAGGEDIKTHILAGVSLEKIENPVLVLIASTLLRDADKEVRTVYGTNLGDVNRHVKISLLGFTEMKERSKIEEDFLSYLSTKEFMVVRSIWTGEPVKKGIANQSSLSTSSFRDSEKKFPTRVQGQGTSSLSTSRGSLYVDE